MDSKTKRLHLDILEIEAACDTAAYSARYGALSDDPVVPYLDLTTGQVFWHSDESEEEPDWDHLLPFPDNTTRLESRDLMAFTPEGNSHPWPPVRLFPSPDADATSLLPADTARELLA